MPSAVLDFELSDVCGGGNHATATARQNTTPIGSRRISIPELKQAAEETSTFDALLGMVVEILKVADPETPAEARDLINTLTITIAW